MPPAIPVPDPNRLHPVSGHPRIMFVKNIADLPNMQIGTTPTTTIRRGRKRSAATSSITSRFRGTAW